MSRRGRDAAIRQNADNLAVVVSTGQVFPDQVTVAISSSRRHQQFEGISLNPGKHNDCVLTSGVDLSADGRDAEKHVHVHGRDQAQKETQQSSQCRHQKALRRQTAAQRVQVDDDDRDVSAAAAVHVVAAAVAVDDAYVHD